MWGVAAYFHFANVVDKTLRSLCCVIRASQSPQQYILCVKEGVTPSASAPLWDAAPLTSSSHRNTHMHGNCSHHRVRSNSTQK